MALEEKRARYVLLVGVVLAACNSILGNEDHYLVGPGGGAGEGGAEAEGGAEGEGGTQAGGSSSGGGGGGGTDDRGALVEAIEGAGAFEEPPAEQEATPLGSPVPEEKVYDDGDWSCSVQQLAVEKSTASFYTLAPSVDALYPGSLVQGHDLSSGQLNPIPLARGDGTLLLSLLSGEADQTYEREVGNVSEATVAAAENVILAGLPNTARPWRATLDISVFDSIEELAVELGMRAEWLDGSPLSASALGLQQSRQRHAVVRLTQQFYTVTFEGPASPAEFFDGDVTAQELKPFIGDGNPPAYVSSVTYGRQYYLVLSSSASGQALEAALSALERGELLEAGEVRPEYQQAQELTSAVIAVGADPDADLVDAVRESSGDLGRLAKYLEQGGDFRPDDPSSPVFYTVRDLATRQPVRVSVGTEYEEARCFPVVDDERLRLSLDANDATTGAPGEGKCADISDSDLDCDDCQDPVAVANTNFVIDWPGRSVPANSPTWLNNLRVASDVDGRQWARFQSSSFAAGLDCSVFEGSGYSVVAVVQPDPGRKGFFLSAGTFVAAGGTNASYKDQFLHLGWQTTSVIRHGHYYDDADFSLMHQGSRQVLVSVYDSTAGLGARLFSNGAQVPVVPNTRIEKPVTPLAECMVGAAWNQWPAFTQAHNGYTTSAAANCASLNGLLGEIRGYKGVLSEEERRGLECELGEKWGVAVAGCTHGVPDEHW